MDLILDTNALSAIAEGERGAAKEFFRASQVALPVIVLGEYRFGIAQSRHKRKYERWLEELVSVCNVLEVFLEEAFVRPAGGNDPTAREIVALFRYDLDPAGQKSESSLVLIGSLAKLATECWNNLKRSPIDWQQLSTKVMACSGSTSGR